MDSENRVYQNLAKKTPSDVVGGDSSNRIAAMLWLLFISLSTKNNRRQHAY